jgi:hypothetical protein
VRLCAPGAAEGGRWKVEGGINPLPLPTHSSSLLSHISDLPVLIPYSSFHIPLFQFLKAEGGPAYAKELLIGSQKVLAGLFAQRKPKNAVFCFLTDQ